MEAIRLGRDVEKAAELSPTLHIRVQAQQAATKPSVSPASPSEEDGAGKVQGPRPETGFRVTRAGASLGVADICRSLRFYRDQLGLRLSGGGGLRRPAYATPYRGRRPTSHSPSREHRTPDGRGCDVRAQRTRSRASVVLVLEVDDAHAAMPNSATGACQFLGRNHPRRGGGSRFVCVWTRYGYLVEIEEPRMKGGGWGGQ